MKRAVCFLAPWLSSLGFPWPPRPRTRPFQPPGAKRASRCLDANADGKVTKEEFLAASQKRAEARFSKLDKDNKGYLTKEDFLAAREKAREKAKNRKPKTDAPQ